MILAIVMQSVNCAGFGGGFLDKLGLGDMAKVKILDKHGNNAVKDFKPNERKCVEMEEGTFCYKCEFKMEGIKPAWNCECDCEELDRKATSTSGNQGIPLPTSPIKECFDKLVDKHEL